MNQLVCEKIKKLRKAKRFSQVYVGEKIGISNQHYSLIENGKQRLNIEHLSKIAETFEVPVSYFFDNDVNYIKDNIIDKLDKAEFNQLYGFLIATIKTDGEKIDWLKRAFPTFTNLVEFLNNLKP